MCRSIQKLYNIDPPASEEEIMAAALQFVRKVSGYRKPTQTNEAVFNQSVEEIASTVQKLLHSLKSKIPKR